jgi:hypothetical protein
MQCRGMTAKGMLDISDFWRKTKIVLNISEFA